MKRGALVVRLFFTLWVFAAQASSAETAMPAGLRVFYTGHSFHMFVPRNVEQLVKSAGIEGHKLVGTQGIGGSLSLIHI